MPVIDTKTEWFTHADRPELGETLAGWASGWPTFVFHDDVADRLWHRVNADFPRHQHYLCAGATLLGAASSIPLRWDGTGDDLPSGWDGALERGVGGLDAGREPTALCALAAQVSPDRLGEGVSRLLIGRLRASATAHGLLSLIAPVRPTLKHRYPLIPMDRYARWRRSDGAHFDPWLRAHERAGGEIVGVAARSMVVTGTVRQWEAWGDMPLPGSGAHIVPGALTPVRVDRDEDVGRYEEPNVWVVHEPSADGA